MNFYDVDPNSLPEQAEYYFNILTVCFYLSSQQMDELFGETTDVYWSIEHVTDPQPYMVIMVRMNEEEQKQMNEEFGTDIQYQIDINPHTVVEVDPTLGVSWYYIEDSEDFNPWKFN